MSTNFDPEHENKSQNFGMVLKFFGLILVMLTSIYGTIMAYKAIMDSDAGDSPYSFLESDRDRKLISHDMTQTGEHRDIAALIRNSSGEYQEAVNELKKQMLVDMKTELKTFKNEVINAISLTKRDIEEDKVQQNIEELLKTLLEKIDDKCPVSCCYNR